jgi:hypothetical protein
MSFLRNENTVCGTTTTGTGTLTLAPCPAPPGGLDLYAAFVNAGLGTAQTIPVTYTIIEYTDATLATAKQMEKGVGALKLGASVSATTLARTTIQMSATALNTTTPSSPLVAAVITIGTAANVLVFIAPSAADIPVYSPYFETALGDNLGQAPALSQLGSVGGLTFNSLVAGGCDAYLIFEWRVPMLVKRCTVNVKTAGTVGTSNADARLYAINSAGRPGKLLYDFGLMGSAGTSFHATGNVSTGAAGAGYFLQPGEYFLDICYVESGETVHAALNTLPATQGIIQSSRLGTNQLGLQGISTATGPAIGAAPDPANVVGYALRAIGGSAGCPIFTLAPS